MTKRVLSPFRGVTAGRAGTCLALALPFALLGVVSLARNHGWKEPDDGALWVDASGQVVLLDTESGGPAEKAGLKPGDILTAIGGRPVRSSISAKNRLWEGRRGTPRSYRILRDGRPMEMALEPAGTVPPAASLYPYLAIVGFFFLFNGAYAAMRLPRSSLATPFVVLSVAMFCVLAISDTSRAETWDWVLFWVDRLGRLVAPAAFLHFVIAFTAGEPDKPAKPFSSGRTLAISAYAAAVVLAAANLLLVGAGRAAFFRDLVRLIAMKDRVELGYMAVCLIGGMALLVRASLSASSRAYRRQLRWMMWGTALGLGPFALFYLVPTALDLESPRWALWTVLPMVVLPLAFTSALLRYRLSDLELFIKRGISALSVFFFTFAVWELLTILIGGTLGAWLAPPSYTTAGLAALLTAILYPQIRAATLATVDRIFYRGRYNFRRTLVGFGRELNSEMDLDALVRKIENRVRQTLDFDDLALYLRDGPGDSFLRMGQAAVGPVKLAAEQSLLSRAQGVSYLDTEDLPSDSTAGQALREADLAAIIPMKVKGEVRAFLAVGSKAAGEPLNSEDLEMLVALSAQAASAIEAARLLRELREKVCEVERLRQTNENILESSRVAILVIDSAGRVQNCNRELENLTGVSRSEAMDRPMSELYSFPLVREIEQMIARASAGEDTCPRTYRSSIADRKGQRVRVNVALSPLGRCQEEFLDGRAGCSGWVVTLDDVTEQVRLEEQLLRQDRLAAIGLLASSVAHEVNTPLTGISSYAQILLEDMDPSDPRYELLNKIERQTARASSIANTLLNFSRGGKEGHEALESLDLGEVVEETLSLFEPQLRGGNIRLVRKIEPGLPRVAGHRGKLQQVLLNLLLNARDAIDSEGVVRVSLRRGRSNLILEVSDDGCGISEEDLARVFDPFFTTKSRRKGTGLGLSLSYNIIREHQGEVSVDSRPGEGATFTVELPLDRRAAATR